MSTRPYVYVFLFLLILPKWASLVYPKKVPEDIFHPLEVLMWEFNDILSLEVFPERR